MCGIFGIIGRNARVPADVLERATQSLAHRGPDDSGTVILRDSAREDVEIGLGNRRLAILDLSPQGHQPMNDPATGNWIVYNGEVYNFREVRAKLEQAGLYFRSNSDTEVILKAYAHWGEKCLHEFRGMFAFAIWDAQQHRLFVARDPMGIKPLYFYHSDPLLHFFFRGPDSAGNRSGAARHRSCRPGQLSDLWIALRSEHVGGRGECAPARLLSDLGGRTGETGAVLGLGRAETLVEAATHAVPVAEKRGELETQVAEMLDESVRMQLVSDVPVGVFLSGGIDSSSLVGILSRNGIRPSTFSIVFREEDYSEAEYSRAIAQQFHTDHHEITVTQSDFFAAIDPAIRCDGSAHDRRHQHILRVGANAGRRRESRSFRAGRR